MVQWCYKHGLNCLTRQRRCLRHEGSGNTRQRQCYKHGFEQSHLGLPRVRHVPEQLQAVALYQLTATAGVIHSCSCRPWLTWRRWASSFASMKPSLFSSSVPKTDNPQTRDTSQRAAGVAGVPNWSRGHPHLSSGGRSAASSCPWLPVPRGSPQTLRISCGELRHIMLRRRNARPRRSTPSLPIPLSSPTLRIRSVGAQTAAGQRRVEREMRQSGWRACISRLIVSTGSISNLSIYIRSDWKSL